MAILIPFIIAFLYVVSNTGQLVVQEIMPPPIEPAQEATAMRVLAMNVKDMKYCEQNHDCKNPNKPVCHPLLRLCKSPNEAGFDVIYGDCLTDLDCQPMYRCQANKCHFSGPRGCDSEPDCLIRREGLVFRCKELPRSAPGKRCWMKCTADSDCYSCDDSRDLCRLPSELRNKITCCEGFCQRKIACSSTLDS